MLRLRVRVESELKRRKKPEWSLIYDLVARELIIIAIAIAIAQHPSPIQEHRSCKDFSSFLLSPLVSHKRAISSESYSTNRHNRSCKLRI
ncbi:hypothetical protein CPB83DRAFT_851923, partial [Crepidotus variabilis]